jgi:DNA polymerase/3'-5' exonuclease PolX
MTISISGDIDLLVTYKESYGEASAIGSLGAIIESLTVSGYIVGTLVSGPKKYMGYVRLAPTLPARRLDILLTPPTEFPYAVLYFTGSDKFNIAFRRHCLTLGYTLNEHTLTPTKDGVPAVPPMSSEEDIFAFVGLKYVPPTERVDGRQIKKL